MMYPASGYTGVHSSTGGVQAGYTRGTSRDTATRDEPIDNRKNNRRIVERTINCRKNNRPIVWKTMGTIDLLFVLPFDTF